ncbi:hypothetical protein M0R04_14715 [Candidatus Dojkabacteria bacterium]|jgi:hypothetical protein|nr:hypothetical protein [Candidatus Dojkabacteria bacterium]
MTSIETITSGLLWGVLFMVLWLFCSFVEAFVGNNYGIIMAILIIGVVIIFQLMEDKA